jgi:ElaB/YqjD/DUF883 family membrane-anchored ribosome-binding protein
MNDYKDNRSPEEIEGDIERTRADVSSTIDAIQSKLTPGQLMDQAVSYARTSLPADFGANLGNTIRDNPMPVALIGVGIAWLMSSGRHSDGQARLRRQNAIHESTYDMSSSSHMEAGSSGDGTMHRAASKASETGRGLKDKASELGQRISDKTSAITGRAREMTQGARERMSGSAEGARGRVGEAQQRSQQQYYRAKDRFGHMIEEQPLMVGALGVAIGTLLGAVFPSTRREDEMMGRTRDNLLEKAKETASQQAETLKESAHRVAGAAEQEVDRVRSEASSSTGKRGNGHANQAGASGGADISKPGSEQGQQRPH